MFKNGFVEFAERFFQNVEQAMNDFFPIVYLTCSEKSTFHRLFDSHFSLQNAAAPASG